MRDWIDIKKETPPGNTMVFVLAELTDGSTLAFLAYYHGNGRFGLHPLFKGRIENINHWALAPPTPGAHRLHF